jgi:hypothetical protein
MQLLKRPGVWLGVLTLVFAVSGSAYAASKITGRQVKDSSLTGADIRNGSLNTADFSGAARSSLRGPQGPAGSQGPAGIQGPAGPSAVAAAVPVTSAQVSFTPDSYAQTVTAFCPAGQRVVSGGGASISFEGLSASQANASRTGWFVVGATDDPTFPGQFVQAYAICAPANSAVAARVGKAKNTAKDKAQIARVVTAVDTLARSEH